MEKNIKLEEARLKQHLSLEEASRRLAVHKNTLLHWEMGRHKPQLSYLTALCKTYDATPEELGQEGVSAFQATPGKRHISSRRHSSWRSALSI